MDTILDALYTLVEPTRESPQERAALRVSRKALEKACPDLTESELDEVWGAAMEAYAVGQQASFRWGFRAGMQLAVEGLRAVSGA